MPRTRSASASSTPFNRPGLGPSFSQKAKADARRIPFVSNAAGARRLGAWRSLRFGRPIRIQFGGAPAIMFRTLATSRRFAPFPAFPRVTVRVPTRGRRTGKSGALGGAEYHRGRSCLPARCADPVLASGDADDFRHRGRRSQELASAALSSISPSKGAPSASATGSREGGGRLGRRHRTESSIVNGPPQRSSTSS